MEKKILTEPENPAEQKPEPAEAERKKPCRFHVYERRQVKGKVYEKGKNKAAGRGCNYLCAWNLLLCGASGDQHSFHGFLDFPDNYRRPCSSFLCSFLCKKEELKYYGLKELKHSGVLKGLLALLLLLVIIFVIGLLISSPVVNAKKYQQLMKVETGEFATDIEELSFDQIPLLDRDSATLLGNRKMGSMVDMVSQFEVDELYSQINYQDRPVRVSPLRYADLIKWFNNNAEGIPAYIKIDMATQNTELVKLDE